MKKLLVVLFVLMLALATMLIGCNIQTAPTRQFFLNDTDLKEYVIVYSEDAPDYNERAANYLKDIIKERTGISLPVIKDSEESESEYEILVGETSRELSGTLEPELSGVKFAVCAKDTRIAIEGDYFVIAAAAYYLGETYFAPNTSSATIPKRTEIHTPIVKEAKNFIMLIGDGMGVYQTKMLEYMTTESAFGDGESLFYGEMLPYHGFSRTDSLSGLTDSAAGGTALSTGYKTENGYVAELPDGTSLLTLPELALSMGLGGGVMSTEGPTGATPASFSAHTNSRGNTSELIDDQFYFEYTLGGGIECKTYGYAQKDINSMESKIAAMLNKLDDNDGFFLMYEEAYIDKHSHNNDLENTYLAVKRFNQAIGRFMEYAFYHPETVVLITADHETGGLMPNEQGELAYSTEDHTRADVPVFAYGYGAEVFATTAENVQIAMTFAKMLGNGDFGDQSEFKPLG